MSSESRAEYYKKAFEKLENEGKHTWNWSAFFFTTGWMAYRKMYLYAICSILAAFGIGFVVGFLMGFLMGFGVGFWGAMHGVPGNITKETVQFITPMLRPSIALVSYIVLGVLCGRYGNYWYRKAVEKKIRKGYHKMKHFCPTSIASAILALGIPLVMFGDWLKKKCEKVKKTLTPEDRMPTKENIELYLNPKKKEGVLMNIIVFIAIMFQLLVWAVASSNFREKMNQIEQQKISQQIEQE